MFNRMTRVALGSARELARKPSAWALIARDTLTGFRITAHHTLMTAGVGALGIVGVLFFNPHLADHVKALSPFAAPEAVQVAAAPSADGLAAAAPAAAATTATAASAAQPHAGTAATQSNAAPAQAKAVKELARIPVTAGLSEADARLTGADPQQKRVTAWIAKRYRVATDATNMLVSAAYLTAREIKLDPLLILAVVAIESRFNPFAESPVGAQGLMQVMSKVHRDKFADHGGIKAALNPVANIKVGSLILKDYVRRGGSVEAGLKLYVGAAESETDSGYGAKVLAEYKRLKEVASGKSVPTTATSTAARPQPKPLNRDDSTEALNEAESAAPSQKAGQPA